MHSVYQWTKSQLSNPQVTILGGMLLGGFLFIYFLGGMLAPFLAALVIAYLLDGIVVALQRLKVPRLLSTLTVFTGFVASLVFLSVILVPAILSQLRTFEKNVPVIVAKASKAVDGAFEWYERTLDERFNFGADEAEEGAEAEGAEEATGLDDSTESEEGAEGEDVPQDKVWSDILLEAFGAQTIEEWGKNIIDMILGIFTFDSFRKLITWVVYMVLVPVLVFFMLKDKDRLIQWFVRFLPQERPLATKVWQEVNLQISNYIRGKFWEIIIVWTVTNITFSFLGLEQAFLLSLFVGLSVIVPYVGAILMYIPIALAAYTQFGFDSSFFWILVLYTVIQVLDGNVLVPVLLSGVTSLHPIGIIVAILICGGLWGFWGIFFAIPLATLFNAVINAWPKSLGSSPPT